MTDDAVTVPVLLSAALSCRLLEVQRQENGGVWPETVAVVLWGTDNIKTYGESLAQVCSLWSSNLSPAACMSSLPISGRCKQRSISL